MTTEAAKERQTFESFDFSMDEKSPSIKCRICIHEKEREKSPAVKRLRSHDAAAAAVGENGRERVENGERGDAVSLECDVWPETRNFKPNKN